MIVISSECSRVIESLIRELKADDFVDAEERSLAAQFHALPLGLNLWSYGFLTSEGELVKTGWEPDEVTRTTEPQEVLRALVIASRRYSSLTAFIPSKPADSITCPLCSGDGFFGTIVGSGEQGTCVHCAGLVWIFDM